MYFKIEKVQDREFLDSLKSKPCVACNKTPCDPAHIRPVGRGGGDEEFNVISLCRDHHTLQHAYGWNRFSLIFPNVVLELKLKGWFFDFAGKLKRDESNK